MDLHSRAAKKNTSHGNDLLPRKILRISFKDYVTNEEVCSKSEQAVGPHEDLLTIAKRRTLHWYGYASRSLGLATTIL